MALAIGLLAAVSVGLSDLFGRRILVATSALTASSTIQMVSVLGTLAFALGDGSTFDQQSFLWGCLSGCGMAFGMAFYYFGLERSSATLIAPIVAALVALVPFSYAMWRGSSTSGVALLGALVAVVGLVLVTGGTVSKETLSAGVLWGSLSGLAYAASTVAFIEASDAGGWWPTFGQRGTGSVLLAAAALAFGHKPLAIKSHVGNVVMSGLVTAVASVAFLAALGADPAIGAMAIATFPAFSVLVGRMYFGDALQRLQIVGIALVICGVAGVSTG